MKPALHIATSGLITAVAIWICWISFTQQPAEAFVFPRLISVFLVAFSLWTFRNGTAWSVKNRRRCPCCRNSESWTRPAGRNRLRVLGRQRAWFLYRDRNRIFVLLTLYDPAPHDELRTWLKRLAVSAGFMAVMYGLFALLLNVYTPREALF